MILGKKCIITIVDSGLSTMTGGRIKKIKKFVDKDQDFMFTYGDGVSDVKINELVKFYKSRKKIIEYRCFEKILSK